ncbi:hypothetical protein LLEC1_04307 [Akanthomyces lecanii]|uniref:Calcineurin-like phosphoesterase domain-containing protein n=1 Tax=Cordyceps confragosa TaxID=2714763 RepID=A0A179I1D2_CORDF|nr:hypothetical protein LLEC1_04307 [Akanthomyces lecanii]
MAAMRLAPLSVLLALATGAPLEAPSVASRPLTFGKDGSFQISVFEDLHFGESMFACPNDSRDGSLILKPDAWDSWGPQQDINSVKVLNNVLDNETPQLVVLNGDLITGENAFVHNGSAYVDQIVKPIVDRGLLWASTYGNHDSDFNLSSASTWARENTYPNCRTGRMAVASTPGMMGLFSGHDHGDTWCYRWDRVVPGTTVAGNGVNLCFGQHSGYGGYGNWIRGARQIRVSRAELRKRNLTAETWIRLENGATVGSVVLNSTFNQDRYPPTKDDMTYCPTCNYTVVTPHPKAVSANKLLEEPSHGEWKAGGEL